MPIKKYKPTSPARRFHTVQVNDDITTMEPYRPLTEPLKKKKKKNKKKSTKTLKKLTN